MKRLIFSDTHFHPWGYGSHITSDGFNSRLVDQRRVAQEMLYDIEEFNIKYIYCCGDLFHQHSNVSVQALYIASQIVKAIRRRGIKLRVTVGNHDQANREGNIHSLQFLSDEEISSPWRDDGLEVRKHDYITDEERLKRFLGEMSKGDQKMVLLHQGVAGVPLSSGYVIDDILTPGMIPDNVKCFTGHYHFHKQVSPNLTVVGNLTPLNWSDIDQKKGWLIWDDETNEIEQRFQSSAPNFIPWDSEKDTDFSVLKDNFVRYVSPVKTKDCDEIRKQFLKEGARIVEFSNVELNEKSNILRTTEKITVDDMIKQMTDKCSKRRKIIGKEIRENSYEPKNL